MNIARDNRWWGGVGFMALILLCAAGYWPSLRGDFLSFDDDIAITHNLSVIGTDTGLQEIWSGQTPDYYPLTYTLYWLEWHNGSGSPIPFRIVHLCLHIASALLLWALLRRWGIRWAWLAAALWAIHPLNAATVGWITEEKNTLAAVLALASAVAFTEFWADRKTTSYWVALVMFAASMLSKASFAPLPLVLAAMIWWKQGRWTRRDLVSLSGMVLVSVVLSGVAMWFQANHAIQGSHPAGPLALRVARSAWAIWFYLHQCLWPTALTIIYPKWTMNPATWGAWAPMVAMVGCLAVLGMVFHTTRNRGPLALAACFGLLILPVLGLIPISFFYLTDAADHWAYPALMVVMVAVAWGVSRLPGRASLVSGALLIGLMTPMTRRRSTLYADAVALWQDNAAKNSTSFAVYNNLAFNYLDRRQFERAEDASARAVALAPDEWTAQQTYATALRWLHRWREADAAYRRTVFLKPSQAIALEDVMRQVRSHLTVKDESASLSLRPSNLEKEQSGHPK